MSAPTTKRRGRPPRFDTAMSGAHRQSSYRHRRAARVKALEDGLRTALHRLGAIDDYLEAGDVARARGVLDVTAEDIQALIT